MLESLSKILTVYQISPPLKEERLPFPSISNSWIQSIQGKIVDFDIINSKSKYLAAIATIDWFYLFAFDSNEGKIEKLLHSEFISEVKIHENTNLQVEEFPKKTKEQFSKTIFLDFGLIALANTAGSIHFLNLEPREIANSVSHTHKNEILVLKTKREGEFFSACKANYIVHWRKKACYQPFQIIHPLECPESSIVDLDWNDIYLFSASFNGNIAVWDIDLEAKGPLPTHNFPVLALSLKDKINDYVVIAIKCIGDILFIQDANGIFYVAEADLGLKRINFLRKIGIGGVSDNSSLRFALSETADFFFIGGIAGNVAVYNFCEMLREEGKERILNTGSKREIFNLKVIGNFLFGVSITGFHAFELGNTSE